jgi:hypothetical protein
MAIPMHSVQSTTWHLSLRGDLNFEIGMATDMLARSGSSSWSAVEFEPPKAVYPRPT